MTGRYSMTPKRPWTTADIATLTERYPTTPTHELAVLMGRTPGALNVKASALDLRKVPCTGTERTQKARAVAAAKRAEERAQRATAPTLHAYRKRLVKSATEAAVKHGVEQTHAELFVHLISAGRIPGVVFDY